MFHAELHGAGVVVALAGHESPVYMTRDGMAGFYDTPGLKTEFEPRVGGHGAVPAPAEYSARTVTLSASDDFGSRPEQRELWERINGLAQGEVRLRVVEPGADTYLTGLIETEYPTGWTWDAHRFVVRVTAADPCRYAWHAQEVTLTPGARSGAVTYDITYPIDYTDGASLESPTGTVVNAGNAPMHPTIVVRGDHPRGFMLTDSEGRTISTRKPLYAGQRVVVDCARRMLLVDGVNRTRLLDSRGWFECGPGGALSVTYQPPTDVPAERSWAVLSARSTWL